jgi:hypothetical protein
VVFSKCTAYSIEISQCGERLGKISQPEWIYYFIENEPLKIKREKIFPSVSGHWEKFREVPNIFVM